MLKQVLEQITKPVIWRMQVQELVAGKFEYHVLGGFLKASRFNPLPLSDLIYKIG